MQAFKAKTQCSLIIMINLVYVLYRSCLNWAILTICILMESSISFDTIIKYAYSSFYISRGPILEFLGQDEFLSLNIGLSRLTV